MLTQFAVHRIDPVAQPERVTYKRVRDFLKITGYSKFYENITQIISLLTKQPPMRLSEEEKTQLTRIFNQIQEPFNRHKGKRNNFLSYAYTIYKSCELLGLDEFKPYLPLLVAPKNLIGADHIWKKICNDCGFDFIPTT